jgi:serine/threonine-protein kinase
VEHVEADADQTVIERLDPRLGMVLAERYQLIHKIAAGGFGAVYIASDLVANRDVAVKLLHPALAADENVAARFRREVEALASLTSPHTVAALDAGEAPDGTPYLVMELLTGESVYSRYKSKGRMPWERVVAIGRGVCDSLAEAHSLGIVHRDLKPENIHLEHRGDDPEFVKVLDFGIAKVNNSTVSDNADLTHVGQMVGTYSYMSPEQMTGTCTPESDVFTLGVVMYELIAGKRPYGEAKGPAAQLAAVLGDAPPLVTPAPLELTRIIARCIDKDPTRRYRNAHELQFALERFSDGSDEAPTNFVPSTSRRMPTPWVEPSLGATLHGIAPNLVARGSATSFSDRKSAPVITRKSSASIAGPASPDKAAPPKTGAASVASPALPGRAAPPKGRAAVIDRRMASGTSELAPAPETLAPLNLSEVSAGASDVNPFTTTPTTATGVSAFATPNMRVVLIAIVIAMALIALGLLL